MEKRYTRIALFVGLVLVTCIECYAQTKITGSVTENTTKKPLIGVSITVKGTVAGTITDNQGQFALTTTAPLPLTLVVSSVGFQTREVAVQSQSALAIELQEQVMLGQEVVVSASRVEESVMKSPVSVEKMDIRTIQSSPAATFYDALLNMKGVDMSTQSLMFRSVNVRGFSANGNTRVVQLVDGMDNQAPGLNFSVGNIAGLSELDVESVELLPGAASALYGPNAINGLLLMTSKNPFQYQGLSAYAKTGIMSASNRSKATTPFYDAGIRYARAFGNRLAFKLSASYISADDWQASDTRDQGFANGFTLGTGNRQNNPGYDGINTYGDASANLSAFQSTVAQLLQLPPAQIALISPDLAQIIGGVNQLSAATKIPATQIINDVLLPNVTVSRTGYSESQLVNYKVSSLKLNGALHYRINDNLEAILQANWGTGTTGYTGQDRFYIKGFSIGQYKAELRGSNFFVRGYTTQERSGDSFSIGILGQGINEAWKPSLDANNLVGSWFPQYAFTYAGGALQTFSTALQQALATNPATAYQTAVNAVNSVSANLHTAARASADQGRFLPGTPQFDQAAATVSGRPLPGTLPNLGAKFLDKTSLYHGEFMYNFSKLIDPKTVELLVGGNYRQYALNSGGTIFALDEKKQEYNITEYGGYAQAAKTIADILKLTGSVRYDKNMNFKAQFSPRLSAVLTLAKIHNIRASFQRGFRIPTAQAQYIDLNTPTSHLIGGLPTFQQKYNFAFNPVYTLESVRAFGAALQGGAAVPVAAQSLQPYQRQEWSPERVETYEVGYKGLLSNKLFIDAYYYYNRFLNFEGAQVVVQGLQPATIDNPVSLQQLVSGTTRTIYSFYVNAPIQVKNHGWAVSADYLLPGHFTIGGNVSFNDLANRGSLPSGFVTFFNTPKYRYNLSFGNRNIRNSGFGFNILYRHQDGFLWESSYANTEATLRQQTTIPAFGSLDAQVSKRIPGIKSILKVGGTNVLGKLYTQAWGNPSVGGMYYVSLTFDELMNR
ncbi:TonB-dependent receptor [Larkinella rosea]|uniref:TonB-dependent receptor n=1 Tax=Larkinella rosea TaxID=2025312 RepID=A0A3P1BTP4_9BACT|nr:TonB-dependent receptor [Larkinella rosea]RRB03904.1 TonB-dependent receptor [Larkinella rosea]